MDSQVHLLGKPVVFSFGGLTWNGQYAGGGETHCYSCSRNLLILLSVILVNSQRLDSSIFVLGTCISCIQPYHLSDFKEVSSGINATSFMERSSASTAIQTFTCSDSEETTKIKEGKIFLNGSVLRVVSIERPPFVNIVNNQFIGVVFELVSALQEKYNFTSKTFPSYDGNWGSENKGSWNGMVGQVKRNEADLGAAPFSITLERAKVVDFSMSFHQEPVGILIPAPTPGNKLTVLIRPLAPEVWLSVFTTVCVLVPSLFVMHIISLRLRRADMTAQKPVNMSRLMLDLIQFIIGSFVQEGLVSPVNKTTRFLIAIWWFLTLILANIYVGYMVSFLSAPKLFDVVDNLEGLLHQNGLRWTYRKNAALEDLFQSSTSGVYKAIGLGAREADLAVTDMAGVEKVLSGHFAFLKEKSFLDVAIGNDFDESHQCRLTVARETFFTAGLALIVQKGCAFLELLDKEILDAVTTGLMEKWKRIHWPSHIWCVNAAQYIVSTQPKARKLNLEDFQGAHFLLLCGFSCASISFIVEIVKKCWRGRRNGTNVMGQDSDSVDQLDSYKIIVIPVKEDIYHKIHKLNLFKAKWKGNY